MVNGDRLKKTKQILEDSQTIIDKLNIMAADDGVITNDEVALINVIDKNLKRYQDLVTQVLEDDLIEEDEIQKMKKLEREITELVQKQAIADGKISVPEYELINALFDCLRSFNSLEDY